MFWTFLSPVKVLPAMLQLRALSGAKAGKMPFSILFNVLKFPIYINMHIPFKQTLPFGCGHYTLANFYNNQVFLEDIKPGLPSFLDEMNDSLKKNDCGVVLDKLIHVMPAQQLNNRVLEPSIFEVDFAKLEPFLKDEYFIPFFVSKKSGLSMFHLVLVVHCLADNRLYIFDSLKTDPEVFEIQDFVLNNHIAEVSVLIDDSIKESYRLGNEMGIQQLYFSYEYFPHLKP